MAARVGEHVHDTLKRPILPHPRSESTIAAHKPTPAELVCVHHPAAVMMHMPGHNQRVDGRQRGTEAPDAAAATKHPPINNNFGNKRRPPCTPKTQNVPLFLSCRNMGRRAALWLLQQLKGNGASTGHRHTA